MTARWITADVFDGLATLDDGSVDLVVTSPPFGWVRSYLPADHPNKAKEMGQERDPAEFIDRLLAVTAELRRVLAPHGSIAIELGDTYAGSGGAGGDYDDGGLRDGQPKFRQTGGAGFPLPKSKCLIPELYRIALAYGINPLTGQESPAGRWRVRNNVTWCRPNPPVGSLGDKWRPATSDVVVACVSDKRYWDDIATRREHKQPRSLDGVAYYGSAEKGPGNQTKSTDGGEYRLIMPNASGAPLLDYWEIPPGGFSGAHYAVFPPALVEPLVKAMAPPKVCRVCGEPSRRIVEHSYRSLEDPVKNNQEPRAKRGEQERGVNGSAAQFAFGRAERSTATLGWSDCGHDNFRPAVVLDCFGGSGTTGLVATGHGHDAVLIDLDERNCELARERIGPFMFDGPIYPSHLQRPEPAVSPRIPGGAQ